MKVLSILLLGTASVAAFAPVTIRHSGGKISSQQLGAEDVAISTEKVAKTTTSSVVKSDTLRDEAQNQLRSESIPFLLKSEYLNGYVGDVGFDPFGFSKEVQMEYLREAELKHGRIAMLAWAGWVAVDMGARLAYSPTDWMDVNSPAAFNLFVNGEVPLDFWYTPLGYLMPLFIAGEICQCENVNKMRDGEEVPRVAGDLGCDFLKILKDKSDEDVNRMKLRELKHARAGMLAFAGVLVQSTIVGANTFPYLEIAA